MKKWIRSNSQMGTYKGVTYGMEDDGDQRYYFVDKEGVVHYADLEDELFAKIDEIKGATEVKLYRNKRNPHKYLEVHNDGNGHSSARQYMKWNSTGVKNYTGDGALHRWRRGNLDELLEDYEEVDSDYADPNNRLNVDSSYDVNDGLTDKEMRERGYIVDCPIDMEDPIGYNRKRIERELADEADAYDLEHGEGIYASYDPTEADKYVVKIWYEVDPGHDTVGPTANEEVFFIVAGSPSEAIERAKMQWSGPIDKIEIVDVNPEDDVAEEDYLPFE